MATDNVREIILDILLDISKNGVYSHIAIRGALEKYQYLSKRDRAFITKVVEGTVERRIEIDYIINQFSSVPVSRMKAVIQEILRSAVYQIRFMGGIPDSAAVNEAVVLAQRRGFYNLKGFVNGVLRTIVRDGDKVNYPDEEKEPVRALSVKYSMPEWLVANWEKEFGSYVTNLMLESFLKERPTTVRFKTGGGISRQQILDSLKSQGVEVKRAPYLPYAYNISGYNYLSAVQAFREGWIFTQDVSSMLVGEIADPHQGDYVIDMCAAPGGKSLHVADKMNGYGMVDARDLSEDKVSMIRENVKRADLINIRPNVKDALVRDPLSEGKADIVLVDAPCSGLGVISRKSDIKYRISAQKIEELVRLQRQILENAASYVRKGGVLIYSTCTIGKRENHDNRQWFLDNFPFDAESLDPYLPEELRSLTTAEGYLQIIPGIYEADGFFIARFRKRGI